MARILSNDELKTLLEVDYSSSTVNKESLEIRKHNIEVFNQISRNNLSYGRAEKQILLYETMANEKVYIQFPGKESAESPAMPLDFRPKVELNNGEMALDLSFGAIWDVLDAIGKEHRAYLSYVAAIFFRLGYMHDYDMDTDSYQTFLLDIEDGRVTNTSAGRAERLEWYSLTLSEDIWFTMNDKIGMIDLGNGQRISFEGFVKLVDLLFQNEDCKYYYKNVVINQNQNYKYNNGRSNSSSANLLILNYLSGNVQLSDLLDSFQKSRGVPRFRKSDYSIVTDGIVINIDVEERI